MTRRTWDPALCGLLLVVLAPAGMAAAAPPPNPPGSAPYSEVAACLDVADPTQRLSCFDKAVRSLVAAERSGEVVVVNRAKVEAVKRQAFGLPGLNALKAFEFHGQARPIEKISFTIAGAHQEASGRWTVTSTDGQVWVQIDSVEVYPGPAAGRTAVVTRASLGSYFLKVGTDTSFRVHRDQ